MTHHVSQTESVEASSKTPAGMLRDIELAHPEDIKLAESPTTAVGSPSQAAQGKKKKQEDHGLQVERVVFILYSGTDIRADLLCKAAVTSPVARPLKGAGFGLFQVYDL